MPSARSRHRRSSSSLRPPVRSTCSTSVPPPRWRTRSVRPSAIARHTRSASRRTDVPGFPRDELEQMWQRWLDANKRCEADRDWRPMADLYTEDATYGWNNGPDDEFMAVGRDEIREIALGLEMRGLEGW